MNGHWEWLDSIHFIVWFVQFSPTPGLSFLPCKMKQLGKFSQENLFIFFSPQRPYFICLILEFWWHWHQYEEPGLDINGKLDFCCCFILGFLFVFSFWFLFFTMGSVWFLEQTLSIYHFLLLTKAPCYNFGDSHPLSGLPFYSGADTYPHFQKTFIPCFIMMGLTHTKKLGD